MTLDSNNITVLNYNQCDIVADSGRESYVFNASKDGIHPTVRVIPMAELKSIASTSNAIEHGWLMFEDSVKERIYEELLIHDWEKILTNDEIRDILLTHTMEGLQKIIDIDNITHFERVRMVLYSLMREGHDIIFRVKNIVDTRYQELQDKKRVSNIILTPKDENATASSNEVKELSAKNIELQSQIDEMKAMMAQLIANQNGVPSEVLSSASEKNITDESTVSSEDNSEKTSTKKSPGRPKKTE